MNARTLVTLVRTRSELCARERWTRDQLRAHQARALADLRAFAAARSPFYRDLHRGLAGRPLEALPVLTKATLMERFDELVTDRDVRRGDVEAHLRSDRAGTPFRGRYRVAATAGTTGRRGLFLYDPVEWGTVLASYARANDWAGVPAGLAHRLRVAIVSTRNPTHQSAIVGATLASRFVPTLLLDAADPLPEVTRALDAFRPDSLVGYASVLSDLADAQLAGRLSIRPKAVMSSSEVLTDEARSRIRAAFGVDPFNVYATTETAGIASDCRAHRLHRYEDLVIVEIVDDDYQPVPPGVFGSKILASVLFLRTQPLIRYEITDRVRASAEACSDGRPFAIIDAIEGREEEVISLPGIDGRPVALHPNVLHAALEPVLAGTWQVVQEPTLIRVLVAGAPADETDVQVIGALSEALVRAGAAAVPVRVDHVAAIPRTALGKAPLIRALH